MGRTSICDPSGKINAAEKELMAAHDALDGAKTDLTSDQLFWLDPWSAEGQSISAKLLPVAAEIRTHAEHAIVLLDQARYADAELREPDALDGHGPGRAPARPDRHEVRAGAGDRIELRARRSPSSTTRRSARNVENELDEISSMNGRCQDLRDAYSAIKSEYSQVWLSENRPYWLNNVTVRYDLAIESGRSAETGSSRQFASLGWQGPAGAGIAGCARGVALIARGGYARNKCPNAVFPWGDGRRRINFRWIKNDACNREARRQSGFIAARI